MSDDQNKPLVFDDGLTAAERIREELNISGGYRFAPGITIHAPSKRDAELMVAAMEGIDMSNPSDADVTMMLRAILGDSYDRVMDYLENFPVEGYPALFVDLFENLLRLVPSGTVDPDEFIQAAEVRWRTARPDLFEGQ